VSGAGGAGGGTCTPKTTQSCYGGPPGTEDVGPCKAGKATCKDDGTGFGPCENEVTPKPETCNTPEDDDCNGKTNEGGIGCVCKPKQSTYCYTGDPKTENVGPCVAGIKTCKDDGTAWGACLNEVTPKKEDCTTPLDEDCDGKTPLCPPAWSVTGGDLESQLVHAVATDGNGDVVIAGEVEGTLKLGNFTLTSAGLVDAFVAKLDKNGSVVWAKRFGDAFNQAALGVAFDGQGNVLVTGYYVGTINFGSSSHISAGGSDVFVAKLAGQDGAASWSKSYGSGNDDQIGTAISVDSGNSPVVTGFFTGTMSIGGTNVTSAGQVDVFVAKLAAGNGNTTWAVKYGGADFETPRAITTDANGDVLLTGDFFGTSFTIGSTTLASAGQQDVFVAKLGSAAGAAVWAKKYGSTGIDIGRGIVMGSTGPTVVGEYEGNVDFGGGGLQSAGGFDIFITEHDAAGAHKQSKRFGGAGDDSALAVASDGKNGDYAIAGFTTGSVDFGTGVLTSAGGRDGVIARLDSKLAGLWSRRSGDATFYQRASGVAIGFKSAVIAAGDFSGKADFGSGLVTSAGSTDVFVAAYP
jgi:hypothetical protein